MKGHLIAGLKGDERIDTAAVKWILVVEKEVRFAVYFSELITDIDRQHFATWSSLLSGLEYPMKGS